MEKVNLDFEWEEGHERIFSGGNSMIKGRETTEKLYMQIVLYQNVINIYVIPTYSIEYLCN